MRSPASLRARRELVSVALIATLFLGVPLFVGELYPFSSATMFARRPEVACRYQVFDPSGKQLSSRRFGLSRNNPHDPAATTLGRNGHGRRRAESINTFNTVPSEDEVRSFVTRRLREDNQLPYIVICRTVLKPDDTGRVVRQSVNVWKIGNPSFEGAVDPASLRPACRSANAERNPRR